MYVLKAEVSFCGSTELGLIYITHTYTHTHTHTHIYIYTWFGLIQGETERRTLFCSLLISLVSTGPMFIA